MCLRPILCSIALLLAGARCLGAELFYMDHDPFTGAYVGPTGPLVVSGELVPGDYDRLLSKIAGDEGRFLALNEIILASDGGDVAEALKIAGLVKSLFSEVIVGPLTGRCVSACFFIYAAAAQRQTQGEGLIGINRPFLAHPQAAQSQAATPEAAGSAAAAEEGRALAQVRAFLRENDVPGYLSEEMFRRPSDDAYWLSQDDLKNLGFRSDAYRRYLREKCAWNDAMEREPYGGSTDELRRMLECRVRVTQADARKALAGISKRQSEGQSGRQGT